MKRGFTLIELLGVIVLLSVILVLAMPNIINSIKKANNKINIYSSSMIYEAVKDYIKHCELYNEEDGNTYCIRIDKLVFEGLLESPVRYNDNDNIENTMSVKAIYNKKWSYSIVNNSECTTNVVSICERVTSSTNGFVPEGHFEPGDEYECSLNNNLSAHFYILDVVGDKVNLIASNNLNTDGEIGVTSDTTSYYSSNTNNYGPHDVYEYIEDYADNWSIIPIIKNYTFRDGNRDCETCGYGSIITRLEGDTYYTSVCSAPYNGEMYCGYSLQNIKARIPSLSEINKNLINGVMPNWLKGDYFLNDSYPNSTTAAYVVTSAGTLTSGTTSGVRPVIQLHKSDLN